MPNIRKFARGRPKVSITLAGESDGVVYPPIQAWYYPLMDGAMLTMNLPLQFLHLP